MSDIRKYMAIIAESETDTLPKDEVEVSKDEGAEEGAKDEVFEAAIADGIVKLLTAAQQRLQSWATKTGWDREQMHKLMAILAGEEIINYQGNGSLGFSTINENALLSGGDAAAKLLKAIFFIIAEKGIDIATASNIAGVPAGWLQQFKARA